MIRSSVEVNAEPLIALDSFVRDFENVVTDIATEAFNVVRGPMLNEMRYYPAVPAGSKYKRTFTLRDGMDVRLIREGGRITLQASSKARYTKYVVGTFDKRRRYQTRKHRQTGWPLIADTVRFWQDAYLDEFNTRFSKVDVYGGVRTVTRNR